MTCLPTEASLLVIVEKSLSIAEFRNVAYISECCSFTRYGHHRIGFQSPSNLMNFNDTTCLSMIRHHVHKPNALLPIDGVERHLLDRFQASRFDVKENFINFSSERKRRQKGVWSRFPTPQPGLVFNSRIPRGPRCARPTLLRGASASSFAGLGDEPFPFL